MLNLFIQYYLFIRCGDIETDSGPSIDAKSLSICHYEFQIHTNYKTKIKHLEQKEIDIRHDTTPTLI